MEELKNNLKLRARNLYLYYYKLLGYPGYSDAVELVNHFSGNRKFDFGKYKGKGIGDIIFLDRQYIRWCLNNIPTFKLNEREQILFDTDTKISFGGYTMEITSGGCQSYEHEGDTYDLELINMERKLIKENETIYFLQNKE